MFSAKNFGKTEKVEKIGHNTNSRSPYFRFILTRKTKELTAIDVPAGNYMFKVSNRNTRARCEVCSKLIIKTLERHHWGHSGVFIVNCEHISHFVLVFLLSTLSKKMQLT